MTSPHSSFTQVAAQTGVIFTFRVTLWLLCRKYLLHALQQDIQGVTAEPTPVPKIPGKVPAIQVEPPTPVAPRASQSIELSTLPVPSTAAPIKNGFSRAALAARTSPLSLARASFAICFEESCIMFLLLMAQSIGFMNSDARLLNWRISLVILLFMNMVIVPLFLTHALTTRGGAPSPSTRPVPKRTALIKIVMAILPVTVYLFLLSYIPLPSGVSVFEPVASILARLTVLGTAILGLLSGFGAVTNAWEFLPSKFRHVEKELTDTDVEVAERSLARIQEDLADRQASMHKQDAAKAPSTSSTWFSRVVPSLRTDSSAMQELRGLEALEADMARNTALLRQRRDLAKAAITPLGRIFGLSGRLLAIYCVVRTANALLNVVYPRSARGSQSPDVLSGILAQLLSHMPVKALREADAGAVARQVGLAFIGWILLGSVRSLLRGGSRVLRLARRAPVAAVLLLALSQLMVTYILSTLVQLRMSFVFPVMSTPGGTDPAHDNILETLPPCDVFGILFDQAFIIGAIGGAVVRWMDERVHG